MTIHNTRSGRVQRRKEIPKERKTRRKRRQRQQIRGQGEETTKGIYKRVKKIKGSKKEKLKEGCMFCLKTNKLRGKQTE